MTILEQKSLNIPFVFDEVKGIFTGYASAFNAVDRVKDTVIKGAYSEEIKSWQNGKKIPVNFEHDKSYKIADNLSKIEEDAKGLLVEWKFSEEAKSIYPDIWQWAVSKAKSGNLFMSIGFSVIKSDLGINRKSQKKTLQPDVLRQIELDHIAITDNPVDTKAKILEVKGLRTPKYPIDLSESWDGQAANARWRDYTKSKDKPSDQYKNGFLYIEDGREDLFGSYHFQVVDIIDGEPMINQRAVIAANAYLHGARRGVKILDEQQKAKAIQIISSIYKRINRLRKENGADLLPEVELKSEDKNYNLAIKDISGVISAKRFLKENKSVLSNNNIENFVDHLNNIFSASSKIQKNNEVNDEPLCEKKAPVFGAKITDDFDSLMDQVAKLYSQT